MHEGSSTAPVAEGDEPVDVEVSRRRPGPRRGPGEPSGPAEVREAVLEAAAVLFGRHGVEAVTLRQIAAEAGVHAGLIGRYVGRRDELIDQVYLHVTGQLVADLEQRPLQPRGFERDSVMGRWTVLVTHYALRNQLPPLDGPNPVEAVAAAAERAYGTDAGSARWRAAQITGSALGWRLFEPIIAALAGIEDGELPAVRADLNLLHNIGASLPVPTTDPRPVEER
ncbi:MAG: TetR/AcrR family transcriptional regulator [Acidimicrobiales bacterium]